MSRGVKDLREMVIRSRHSFIEAGNQESAFETVAQLSAISSQRELNNEILSVQNARFQRNHQSKTSDKDSEIHQQCLQCDLNHQMACLHCSQKSKTSVTKQWGSVSVEPGSFNPKAVNHNYGYQPVNKHQKGSKIHKAAATDLNFDDILKHLSKQVVLSWLEVVKCNINDMSAWCQSGENFVNFAHSWLSQYSEQARNELIDVEFRIMKEQLLSSFRDKQPSTEKFDSLLSVVLHEYSNGCLALHRGTHLFLEYMDFLTSTPNHRTALLADVHCSDVLMKSQFYETVLAIRSFAIVSIWCAVLDCYKISEDGRRLQLEQSNGARPFSARSIKSDALRPKSGRPKTACSQYADRPMIDTVELNRERMYQAIRLGYTDVIIFLLDTHRVLPDIRDSSNKTLVFYAAANNQPDVLRFLLQQTDCCLYVNVAADSGNTPLHVAANRGDMAVANELLRVKDIKVDALNHLCENATPLHLASMHGHKDIVQLLLGAGANPSRTMGNQTAADIARNFEQFDIVNLLVVVPHSARNAPRSTAR